MLRPESRRANRRNASASGPQSYGPDFYQPDGYTPAAGFEAGDGYEPDDGGGPGGRHAGRPRRARSRSGRSGRIRRFFRLRTVRVILALIAVFTLWVAFSVGQALTAPGGGSTSTRLAEWARDHYLGPVVTFGEWVSYNPPKTGGQPSFSLATPVGVAPAKTYKDTHGFVPYIPPKLSSPAGKALPGEGAWRCLLYTSPSPRD